MESPSNLRWRARTSTGESPADPEGLTRLFEAAIDVVDDVFLLFDRSGELVVWNTRTTVVTGYSDEELASMAPAELFVGDGYARVEEAIQRTRTDGTGFVQADLRTKDGASVPKEFTLSQFDTDDSHGVVAVGRNLDKANRYQRRYYRLLGRMTEGFLALDSAWRFIYLNRKAREFYGETDEDPVGQTIWDVFPDIVGTEHETHLRRAVEEQTVQRYESYYEPHDRWYDIRIYPDRDGVSALVTDITERHERERELERTNELLSTLLNGLPVGVLAEDENRRVAAVNEEFLDLFDVSAAPEAIVGADCAAFAEEEKGAFDDPDGFVDGIDARIDASEHVADEQLELADGRMFERSYLPIDFPEGDGHLWVYQETTEQHEYDRTLERQNERLERFASVVSHDLRSPLEVAQGRVELAREECDSEHLDAAEEAHERIGHLVEDLLVLARQGESVGDREPVELARVARECATTVGIDRDRLVIDTERTVRADESRFRQLLENLLRNSVEHGGEGVTVTVGDFDRGFYVEDDGPGIPPKERERVFDAGYSTNPEGTGFGLSIVGDVAEAHGWKVTVTEGREGGTRFEITTE
jgi:PAS domain S-box-containing protein